MITLTGATVPPNSSCTVSLTVLAPGTVGRVCDTTSNVTSDQGTGNQATDCITVGITAPVTEAFQVNYAANLNIGDSVVNITNAGVLDDNDPAGNICVNVYTFDPAEELISCCSCLVTPNGLVSLSDNHDLLSNTLTPGSPTSIVIKLVASIPNGQCNAASPTATTLAPGMLAWGTSLHARPSPSPYGTTDKRFEPADLSAGELAKLTTFCGFVQANGSGFGVCRSCRTGGL
jgi:hypothetical protein